VGTPAPEAVARRGSQVFTVRPAGDIEDSSAPKQIDGIAVAAILRSRRDRNSALTVLADGRYAITTETLIAMGSRQALARWCERRAARAGDDPSERAWWQEAIGALIARG
jgi:hypothetical protein